MSNTPIDSKTLNKKYGLTEIYQHDFDDKSGKCRKCHINHLKLRGELKLCSVIGKEEVARFRDYESR